MRPRKSLEAGAAIGSPCKVTGIPTASAPVPLARQSLRFLVAATLVACPVFLLGLYVDSLLVRLPAKPWPHLALIAWVLASATGAYARRVATAIALCMVADVLLEFRQTGFVYGMGVFLLGQLTFASAFRMREPAPRLVEALPFVAWLGAAFAAISSGLGELRFPVMAYMTAIGLMQWRAAAWFAGSRGTGAAPAAMAALCGAIVFGVSDTLIALDRFHAPVAGARYVIILTYWGALWLIAASASRDERGC